MSSAEKAIKLRKRLISTIAMAQSGFLYAPASFKVTPIDTIFEIVNGCGAAGAKVDFVPDTIWGTRITYSCLIHDFMYEEGHTIEDKDEADRVMLNNNLRIIDRACKEKWYKPKKLMRFRAKTYKKLLEWYGGPAFWANKPGQ